MGRTNYSKMSTQKITKQEEVVENTPVKIDEDCAACAISFDEPDAKVEPALKTGRVHKCTRLNIRTKPNTSADILEVVEVGAEVTVDVKSIGKPWLKVTTANGTKGYCMKDYIEIG